MGARTKDAAVVLLDCGRTMQQPYGHSGKTKFGEAKELLKMFLQQKLLFGPKHEIGVVCFGTEETDNAINKAHGEGYEHVVAAREVETPDVEMVKWVDTLRASNKPADLLDGLVVGLDMLIRKTGDKKYDKTVYLFTDSCCPVDAPEDAEPVVKQMKDKGVNLFVVGLGFSTDGDVDVATDKPKTAAQLQTEAFLAKVCDEVGGSILPSGDVMDNLRQFRAKTVSQTSKCRTDLEITPHMRVPVWVYLKTKKDSLPTAKKRSKLAPADTEGKVRMSRSYHLADDPDGEEVPPADMAKAFKYGRQLVPVAEYDEGMLKAKTDRCLTVLGSVDAKSVPRHLFLANVECVAAEPNNTKAAVALSSLARALFETNTYLVCRYVWRANSAPKLAVLTPKVSARAECLYLNYLPFNEDLRTLSFPPLPQPTAPQVSATDALVDAMCMCPADGEELLKPRATFNPAIQRFNQALIARALDPKAPIPDLDPRIDNYLRPDAGLRDKAVSSGAVASLKANFKLERVEAAAGKVAKKRFWREAALEKEQGLATAAAAIDVKKIKVESQGDMDISAAAAGGGAGEEEEAGPRKIGTVQPVRDFEAMMRNPKRDLVADAIAQMGELVGRLLKESLGKSMHAKAIECLVALRKGCVAEREPGRFNAWLPSLKDLCLGGGLRAADGQAFWSAVRDRNLTLISTKETPGVPGGVSEEEAANFFMKSEPAAPAPPPEAPQEAEEDLMDLIM